MVASHPSPPSLSRGFGCLTFRSNGGVTPRPPSLSRGFGCLTVRSDYAVTTSKVLEYGNHFLPREDPDAAALVKQALEADGIIMHQNVRFTKVERAAGGPDDCTVCPFMKYTVVTTVDGVEKTFVSDCILNGTGRAPNVHGIGLEAAGVDYDSRIGVKVNEFYQTANPDVYACGDVASPFKFTHAADFSARLAIRNMFLGDTNTEAQMVVPWCTYVDPEVAHVGMYEAEMIKAGIPHETFTRELHHIDRCKAEGVVSGFVKIHVKEGTDEMIGATIVSPHAGDMISEITTCIQYGIGAAKLAGVQHPYPTQQEAVRQCAFTWRFSFCVLLPSL
jgi:pyruvate/2-oxoglutarate dehydrogenase complex dihydrolipoamide dehydrogenase (E3) component